MLMLSPTKIDHEPNNESSSRSTKYSFLTLHSTSRSIGSKHPKLSSEGRSKLDGVERVGTGSDDAASSKTIYTILAVDTVSLVFALKADGTKTRQQHSADARVLLDAPDRNTEVYQHFVRTLKDLAPADTSDKPASYIQSMFLTRIARRCEFTNALC